MGGRLTILCTAVGMPKLTTLMSKICGALVHIIFLLPRLRFYFCGGDLSPVSLAFEKKSVAPLTRRNLQWIFSQIRELASTIACSIETRLFDAVYHFFFFARITSLNLQCSVSAGAQSCLTSSFSGFQTTRTVDYLYINLRRRDRQSIRLRNPSRFSCASCCTQCIVLVSFLVSVIPPFLCSGFIRRLGQRQEHYNQYMGPPVPFDSTL